MATEHKRICDVIAGSPAAEDVLEDAGVDYWFGWGRELSAACEAARVNPNELASRLASCPPCATGGSESGSLAGLLSGSDEQWRAKLAPAIAVAIARAAQLTNRRGHAAGRLLSELQAALDRHMATSRSLRSAADAIEQAQTGSVDRRTIRSLRLEHLTLDRIAGDLRAEAGRLAADAGAAGLVVAMRTVIRETHRHLKVAYNFILPRLVAAGVPEPTACELW